MASDMFDETLIKDGCKDVAYKQADSYDAVKITSDGESSKLEETLKSFCDEDKQFEGQKPRGSGSCRNRARQMLLSMCRTVEAEESGQRKRYVCESRRIEEVSSETIQQIRGMSLHWGSGADDSVADNTTRLDGDVNGSSDDSSHVNVVINDEHIISTDSVSISTSDDEGIYLDSAWSSSHDDDSIVSDLSDLIPVDRNTTNYVKLESSASDGVYMEVCGEHGSYRVRQNKFKFQNAYYYSFIAYQRNFIHETTSKTDEMFSFSIQLDGRSYFLRPSSPRLSPDQTVLELSLSAVSRDRVMTSDSITRFGELFFFFLHVTHTNDLALESVFYPGYYISFEYDGIVLRKMSTIMDSAFIDMPSADHVCNTNLNTFG